MIKLSVPIRSGKSSKIRRGIFVPRYLKSELYHETESLVCFLRLPNHHQYDRKWSYPASVETSNQDFITGKFYCIESWRTTNRQFHDVTTVWNLIFILSAVVLDYRSHFSSSWLQISWKSWFRHYGFDPRIDFTFFSSKKCCKTVISQLNAS